MSLAEQERSLIKERETNSAALKILSFSPAAPDAELNCNMALDYLALAQTNLELARRFYVRAKKQNLSSRFLDIGVAVESLRSTLEKE